MLISYNIGMMESILPMTQKSRCNKKIKSNHLERGKKFEIGKKTTTTNQNQNQQIGATIYSFVIKRLISGNIKNLKQKIMKEQKFNKIEVGKYEKIILRIYKHDT